MISEGRNAGLKSPPSHCDETKRWGWQIEFAELMAERINLAVEYFRYMGTASLVLSLLEWQIRQWKPFPFSYSVDPNEFEVLAQEQFPDAEPETIRMASKQFVNRFLKRQPLHGSAVPSESAIRQAKEEGISVAYSRSVRKQLQRILYRRCSDNGRKDRVRRVTLQDQLDLRPASIKQTLYVLWVRGEVDVRVSTADPVTVRSVAMTDIGRKRVSNRLRTTME